MNGLGQGRKDLLHGPIAPQPHHGLEQSGTVFGIVLDPGLLADQAHHALAALLQEPAHLLPVLLGRPAHAAD
jgi:hypothetical protein